MHANLDLQNDLITLGLHNDIRGAQTTFQLVESMVDVGTRVPFKSSTKDNLTQSGIHRCLDVSGRCGSEMLTKV
eukprot:3909703-Amphidinium_carterae.3